VAQRLQIEWHILPRHNQFPYMKVMFSLLSGFLFVSSCLAQSEDQAAKQILDKASAKIKSYKSIQVQFSYQLQDAQGTSQGTKKGTASMKGVKYLVHLSGQEIYCDGKTIWTYDKSSNEVTITKVDPSATTISPQKLFTNFYDKDFLYKVNGEQKTGAKTVAEIEMTPRDKTQNFHKVYLYVDKKTFIVSPIKVLDKNGNRYVYTVISMNGNAELTDASFMFDKSKHPGVEEINLTQ
jgi:outer membrane lipoprotein-sorting protein